MKNILIIIFLFLFLFDLQAQEKIKTGAELCSEGKQHRAFSLSFAKQSSANAPKHSFDVLHYSINLDLYKNYSSPYPKSFTGSVTILLRADSAISSITLNAVNTSLSIDSVKLAGTTFIHSGNILTIQLDRKYQLKESLSVTIFYKHKDVVDAAFYVGTDGMVFTDAEPEGARYWFPCWDKPSDKATVELFAKVPSSVKLGSNGLLIDTTRIADTLYYHWLSKEPVATYLVVISSKVNYNLDIVYWKKLSNQNDSIPIFFYWNTGESQTGLNNIKTKIIPMTTRYSELFGEHPFQKNGFATMNNMFTWGGMENQTLTSLLPNGYTNENLISHEYAHQWFGDKITCATWADIWLNEGFATYSEALWYEYTSGYSRYKTDINADATGYLSSNPGRPIYVPSWTNSTPSTGELFNTAMTYNKGACVLHMLRYVLGDSTFFSTLHEYGTNPSLKFGTITTDDFIQQINTSTKQDLTWFFDQWLKVANHPLYSIQYSVNVNDSTARVVIAQTQTSGAFWKMPIALKFSLLSGKDTTVKVFNAVNKDTFNFKFPSQPVTMVFDPNNDIVLKKAIVVNIGPYPKTVPGTLYAASGSNDGGNLYAINTLNGVSGLIRNTGIPQLNSLRVHPKTKELIGYNTTGTSSGGVFYRISSDAANFQQISVTDIQNLKGLAIYNDSMAYTGAFSGAIYTVNLNTGVLTQIGTNGSTQRPGGLALNPIDGTLWMSLRNTSGAVDNIYKLNRTTGLSTLVGSAGIGMAIIDIVFDKNGTLFGLSGTGTAANTLVRIDTSSGAATVIGSLGKSDIQAIAIDLDSPAGVLQQNTRTIPTVLLLEQNFPNPFNPKTTIRYALPTFANVKLAVYDLLGREITTLVNEEQSAGWKKVEWNATNNASGIYYYRLQTDHFVETRKMSLIK